MKAFVRIAGYGISALLVCGFFVWAYSWLGREAGIDIFNSPDETANAFFIQQFANGESLKYQESLNQELNGLVHPRSMRAVGDKVVPVSFYGIFFVYGLIVRVFGNEALIWLTPLFAVAGALAIAFFAGRTFGRRTGVLSFLILLPLAPWWYAAERGMYHNMLFVSLFAMGMLALDVFFSSAGIAGYVFRKDAQKKKRVWNFPEGALRRIGWAVAAGFLFGIAAVVRLSEAGWMAAAVGAYAAVRMQKRHIPGLFLIAGVAALALVPVIAANYALYGASFSVGYADVLQMRSGEGGRVFQMASLLFAPFGISVRTMAWAAGEYLFKFFWWWSAAVGFGALWWLMSPSVRKRREWGYVLFYGVLSFLLVVLYGSWEIVDRIDDRTVSLGTSYVRYFLPIYAFGVPLAALWIDRLVSAGRNAVARAVIMAAVALLFAVPSARVVWQGTDESILQIRATLAEYRRQREAIKRYIPKDALVVTYPQLDKVLFPSYRRIIPALAVPEDFRSLARFVRKGEEVYFVHFAPPETAAAISRRAYEPYGIYIDSKGGVLADGWNWVYRIQEKKEPLPQETGGQEREEKENTQEI